MEIPAQSLFRIQCGVEIRGRRRISPPASCSFVIGKLYSLTFLRSVTILSAETTGPPDFPMYTHTDLALYDRSGRLTAVAEIKNKLGTSREWAAQTRRNILAHGESYSADFFLLVTPDRLYLWKEAGADPVRVLPTFEADIQEEFVPYFESAGVNPLHVSGHAFELLVAAWLGDITRSATTTEDLSDDQSWLAKSGFRAAIRDGRIEYQAVA